MAIAVGLGAYELALLAAAAVGALFFSTPAGQQATKSAVQEISKALESTDEDTNAPAKPIADCPPQTKPKCPPCPPPPPPRIDKVPPSKPHWPCPGDHMHVFEMNQNPMTCECFPKEKDDVICL